MRPHCIALTAGQKLARPWRVHRLRSTYQDRVANPIASAVLRVPRVKLGGFSDLPEPLREASARLLAEASRVLNHEVDYLGSGFVMLGAEIQWEADLKSGHRWPRAFYLDVALTRLDDDSDAKFPWQLSRCHHLLTLARAARIYEDDRFATELEAQLWSWLEANPPGYGINWVNPMEAAIRVINWLWAIGTLEQWRMVDASLRAALTRSLEVHGRHIAANLERSPLPRSNHYVADILGLLALGAFLTGDPEAPKWLRFSQRELEVEIMRQVLPDGVGFEASLPYHGLALEMFLLGWRISQLAGRPLSLLYRERLIRMLLVSQTVRHPDGRSPIIGDQDSGRVLPGGFLRPPTHDHLLDVGSALLNLPRLTSTTCPNDEVAWTLGLQAWFRLSDREHRPQAASHAFRDGGLYVLSSGDVHLVARWGGVGQNGYGGHAHNDLSSYELSYGVPVVVDSGSYLYTADQVARDEFRSARAHNVVVVDGLEMHALPDRESVQTRQHAGSGVETWEHSSDTIVLRGWHDGYRPQGSNVICRRTIKLERASQRVEIIDDVEGEGKRHVESLMHLAVGCRVTREGPYELSVKAGDRELTIEFEGAGTLTVEDGWVSSRYGVREPAPLIRAATHAELPVRLSYTISPRESPRMG
jgi:hypothetical protein